MRRSSYRTVSPPLGPLRFTGAGATRTSTCGVRMCDCNTTDLTCFAGTGSDGGGLETCCYIEDELVDVCDSGTEDNCENLSSHCVWSGDACIYPKPCIQMTDGECETGRDGQSNNQCTVINGTCTESGTSCGGGSGSGVTYGEQLKLNFLRFTSAAALLRSSYGQCDHH